MQQKVIAKLMHIISNKQKLTDVEYEQIVYGLTSIYMLITKLIIISFTALVLGIFKEMLIFLLLFNIIRIFAFGLHATKSYICLIVSSLAFLVIPYISNIIVIPNYFKIIIGIVLTLLILRNSPADTYKRPIISKKRRLFFKVISTIISCIYVILSLYTPNFISNSLIFSLLLENIFISPITYKLFNLPYNNYKNYLERENLNVS